MPGPYATLQPQELAKHMAFLAKCGLSAAHIAQVASVPVATVHTAMAGRYVDRATAERLLAVSRLDRPEDSVVPARLTVALLYRLQHQIGVDLSALAAQVGSVLPTSPTAKTTAGVERAVLRAAVAAGVTRCVMCGAVLPLAKLRRRKAWTCSQVCRRRLDAERRSTAG